MKRLTRNLRDNSIEAFILALETINRPSISYRLEAFCFLICNSWELLMKAKLFNDGSRIFRNKKRKQPRESITFDECLGRILTKDNDPIRLNLKAMHDLRNGATHLVIPFIPKDIMGLFQAGVINYSKQLQNWFKINLSDRIPLGMMVHVYDFDPKQHSLEHAKMSRKLPVDTIRWLTEFQKNILLQATAIGDSVQQFYIPINLNLALVKNPNKSDINLSAGTGTGAPTALVVEVPKAPDKTHPYQQKDVVNVVNQKLQGVITMSTHDNQNVKQIYHIPNKVEFYYKSKFSSPQYSEQFVNWLIEEVTKNPKFFLQTKEKVNLTRLKTE